MDEGYAGSTGTGTGADSDSDSDGGGEGSLRRSSGEEKVRALRRRLALLAEDMRAQREAAEWSAQENADAKRRYQEENTLIMTALAEIQDQKVSGQEQTVAGLERADIARDVLKLRSEADRCAGVAAKKEAEVEVLRRNLGALVEAGRRWSTSAVVRSRESIETRMDEALIRTSEALSIRQTYESVIRRMEAEQSTYDARLLQLESAIRAKKTELRRLKPLRQDAETSLKHALDEKRVLVAKVSAQRQSWARRLARRQRTYDAEREAVRNGLMRSQRASSEESEAKVSIAQAAMAMRARQSTSRRDSRRRSSRRQMPAKDALALLCRETGSAGADDFIARQRRQTETSKSLEAQLADARARLDELVVDAGERRAELDGCRFVSSDNDKSSAAVSRVRARLAAAQEDTAARQRDASKASHTLGEIWFAVSSLQSKLRVPKTDRDADASGETLRRLWQAIAARITALSDASTSSSTSA